MPTINELGEQAISTIQKMMQSGEETQREVLGAAGAVHADQVKGLADQIATLQQENSDLKQQNTELNNITQEAAEADDKADEQLDSLKEENARLMRDLKKINEILESNPGLKALFQ